MLASVVCARSLALLFARQARPLPPAASITCALPSGNVDSADDRMLRRRAVCSVNGSQRHVRAAAHDRVIGLTTAIRRSVAAPGLTEKQPP